MKVVIDNNLPYSLARLLSNKQFDAIHVVDLNLSDASDNTLRNYFSQQQIIFVSRDIDLFRAFLLIPPHHLWLVAALYETSLILVHPKISPA